MLKVVLSVPAAEAKSSNDPSSLSAPEQIPSLLQQREEPGVEGCV